jgi:hypothetical protein
MKSTFLALSDAELLTTTLTLCYSSIHDHLYHALIGTSLADLTTMTTEERIIRSYCPRSLNKEYDAMSSAERATLREAILTTVRMRTLNYMQNPSRSTTPSTDPFVILLKELMPHIPPPAVYLVTHLKELLFQRGAISSSVAQYQQIVAQQRTTYLTDVSTSMNTSSAVTKRGSEIADWNLQLRKISFSDLVLFQTAKGCYIEGKIAGEPIQPMVGGTTLIQEFSTKRNIMICFYNILPDGIWAAAAEPLLQQEFPMGATLRVAEPFLKIFGDGQRGVRVDNPRELHVIKSSNRNCPYDDDSNWFAFSFSARDTVSGLSCDKSEEVESITRTCTCVILLQLSMFSAHDGVFADAAADDE